MKIQIYGLKPIVLVTLIYISGVLNVYAHGLMESEPEPIDTSTYPPVERDIQALSAYSPDSKAAANRLVERGVSSLNELHAALLDPSASFQQRMQLISVLGAIGAPGSVELILDVANDAPNNRYLYQNTLLTLTNFEQTEAIVEFVDAQLEDAKRDPLIQRTALAYHAQHPTSESVKWVEQYAASGANPDVRYAALFLGGVLGVESVKDEILSLLGSGKTTAREYYLLIGLSEITTPDEFNLLTAGIELNPDNLNKVRQLILLRTGEQEQRHETAQHLLTQGDVMQRRTALKYLIQEKDTEILSKHWRQGDGDVRSGLRRAGLEIRVSKEGDASLGRYIVPQEGRRPVWLAVLAILMVLSAIWYWRTRTDQQ